MPGEGSSHDGVADPRRVSTRQEFAAELSLLKDHAGLTVRDVAGKIGVPASTLGGYFGGSHLPPGQAVRFAAQNPRRLRRGRRRGGRVLARGPGAGTPGTGTGGRPMPLFPIAVSRASSPRTPRGSSEGSG